jgi:glycosyltransferase involved in cell wall biosynthesis
VTIAIPTFKRAKFLKEAVDSAINQVRYTDYDIIVVANKPA